MKNSSHVGRAALLAALLLVFAAATVMAQDPVKVAPNNFKVLLENDQVRVLDFHSKPGEKIGMHSHPDYVTYGVSGAKTKFTSTDFFPHQHPREPRRIGSLSVFMAIAYHSLGP